MRTCLVVDDSSVIRKVARRFGKSGFQIIESEDARRRLRFASADCLRDPARWKHDVMAAMNSWQYAPHARGDQPKVVSAPLKTSRAIRARASRCATNTHKPSTRTSSRRNSRKRLTLSLDRGERIRRYRLLGAELQPMGE